MQYNTQREQLVMPEYGRTIQQMVDMAISLESKEERQRCAETIVKMMACLQPASGNRENNEARLWNHLARIARYKLDIDYPISIVPHEEAVAHPQPLHYPMTRLTRRHYGHLVEQALAYAQTIEDEKQRQTFTECIANQMKQDLYSWNRDAMDHGLIAHDIEDYSDGQLKLDLSHFSFDAVGDLPYQAETTKKRKHKR